MNLSTFKTVAALTAILLMLAAPAAIAQKVDIKPQIDDVKTQQKEADEADKAAKDEKSQPAGNAKTKADAEDKAQQHLDDVKENPGNYPKGEKEKAEKEAGEAAKAADKAVTGVKNGQSYRDKLKKRHAKQKLLKAALQHLKDAIKNANKDGKTISPEQLTEANNAIQSAEAELGKLGPLSMALPAETGTALALLVSQGKVQLTTSGTGETIGHIADCKIQNLTNQPLACAITPMILESGSGKNQHYACPRGQSVALQPNESKTVPVNGVCLNHNRPPVGKGVAGDLLVNDGQPAGPEAGTHLPAHDVAKVLGSCAAKYAAVDLLQKSGELKGLPYPDPQKQRDICVEWSVWTDPEIAKSAGSPPATKEDLRKVVYKQVEEGGPMTLATRKKVDQGIDTIFAKVELTTAKAKDLEPANPPPGNGIIEVGDKHGEADVGPSATREKPKKKNGKWPKPIQDWWDKKKAADDAAAAKKAAAEDYTQAFVKFLWKSPHYKELLKQRDDAAEKAKAPGATQQDKDDADKAGKALLKQEDELEKDYQRTPAGEKAQANQYEANKAATEANKAEQEAGKNLDKTTKDYVEKTEIKEALKAIFQPANGGKSPAPSPADKDEGVPSKW